MDMVFMPVFASFIANDADSIRIRIVVLRRIRSMMAVARQHEYANRQPPTMAHAANHEEDHHRTRPVHDASRMPPTPLRENDAERATERVRSAP